MARRVVKVGFIAVLLVTGTIMSLIGLGVFDPKPSGTSVAVLQPGPYTVPEQAERYILLDPGTIPVDARESYSLILTAAYHDGERDSGYGLTVGNENHRLVVALSPLGYVSVREMVNGLPVVEHLPWQPWPHVKPGTNQNEILAQIEQTEGGSMATVRLNRELLWRGEIETVEPTAGLWLGSYGNRVTVDFDTVEWFAK